MLPENHMDQQITPVLLDLLRKARRHPEIAPARPLSSQMKSGLQTVTLYFQKPMVFLRKNNKNANLSDVRTGRAFWGGEHDARLSCVLCMCDLRG